MAENLGVITPEVEALREQFGFPGMAILQFAFGDDAQANDFLPHNYPRNRVVYTGTPRQRHDGRLVDGRGGRLDAHARRRSSRSATSRLRYVGGDGSEIHWDFIRTVLASVADTAIVPLQDVLGAGQRGAHEPARPPGRQLAWRFAGGA